MLVLGSIMAIAGLSLLWFSPYTGLVTLLVGLGIAWSSEDQKIKKKNEKKLYEEENERQFNQLRFEDPVSPRLFELSTLIYGTIKPHEAWLLEQLNSLEEMYSNDGRATIEETQNFATGKFGNLFSDGIKYNDICIFLARDVSPEIYEDIENRNKGSQQTDENAGDQVEPSPDLNDLLADYDLEEWAKAIILKEISTKADRNTIIKNVVIQAKKELSKSISVSCLHDEWIINGRIRFKI